MAWELFRSLLAAGTGIVAITFFWITWRLICSDRNRYEQNRKRSKSLIAVLRGTVQTTLDGDRDHNVNAGLAVDTGSNRWVEQGKLSDEAIESVLLPTRRH